MSAAAEVRTYKLRRGRVTAGQAAALAGPGGRYLLPPEGPVLDLAAVFGRSAEVVLEVGFGMGEATAELAGAEPERDVVAVDVHTPGVGALLARLGAAGLDNVRVVEGDAVGFLRERIAPSSLAGVRVFFPDPWPKTRHAKRRLLSSSFCDLLASRLRSGGFVHLVTDAPSYAEEARRVLAGHAGFVMSDDAPPRATTRFEGQAVTAGRPILTVCAVRT